MGGTLIHLRVCGNRRSGTGCNTFRFRSLGSAQGTPSRNRRRGKVVSLKWTIPEPALASRSRLSMPGDALDRCGVHAEGQKVGRRDPPFVLFHRERCIRFPVNDRAPMHESILHCDVKTAGNVARIDTADINDLPLP